MLSLPGVGIETLCIYGLTIEYNYNNYTMQEITQIFNLTREIISPLNQFEIRDLLSLDGPTDESGKLITRWEKLSNSGDTLKLLVPSYNLKVVNG